VWVSKKFSHKEHEEHKGKEEKQTHRTGRDRIAATKESNHESDELHE